MTIHQYRHAWYAGRSGIAASVARAIDNGVPESCALIAEWDRRGSDCLRVLAADAADALLMVKLTRERANRA